MTMYIRKYYNIRITGTTKGIKINSYKPVVRTRIEKY